jgi:hypothetical protein
MNRSNTLVELKPAAAAISLIDRSGRLRSKVLDSTICRSARHAENVRPVRWRTTCASVWG